MQVNHAPALNAGMVNSVHKNRSGSVAVSVDVPKSLMEFYGSMPQCDYSVYVNAEVNPSVASKVLSTLAPLVNGKSEAEAANLLINFVQTLLSSTLPTKSSSVMRSRSSLRNSSTIRIATAKIVLYSIRIWCAIC